MDFHRFDLDCEPGGFVPAAYALPLTASLVRLKGTDAFPPRCAALQGTPGIEAVCSIYANRPGSCRELEVGSAACNRARRRHGLFEV